MKDFLMQILEDIAEQVQGLDGLEMGLGALRERLLEAEAMAIDRLRERGLGVRKKRRNPREFIFPAGQGVARLRIRRYLVKIQGKHIALLDLLVNPAWEHKKGPIASQSALQNLRNLACDTRSYRRLGRITGMSKTRAWRLVRRVSSLVSLAEKAKLTASPLRPIEKAGDYYRITDFPGFMEYYKVNGGVNIAQKLLKQDEIAGEFSKETPSKSNVDKAMRRAFALSSMDLMDWRKETWAEDMVYDAFRRTQVLFVGVSGQDNVTYSTVKRVQIEIAKAYYLEEKVKTEQGSSSADGHPPKFAAISYGKNIRLLNMVQEPNLPDWKRLRPPLYAIYKDAQRAMRFFYGTMLLKHYRINSKKWGFLLEEWGLPLIYYHIPAWSRTVLESEFRMPMKDEVTRRPWFFLSRYIPFFKEIIWTKAIERLVEFAKKQNNGFELETIGEHTNPPRFSYHTEVMVRLERFGGVVLLPVDMDNYMMGKRALNRLKDEVSTKTLVLLPDGEAPRRLENEWSCSYKYSKLRPIVWTGWVPRKCVICREDQPIPIEELLRRGGIDV